MAPLKMQRDERMMLPFLISKPASNSNAAIRQKFRKIRLRMIDVSLNFLKNCVLGPSGPKIEVKAVQETVGSSLRGTGYA
jgi:hypothetical protein